MGKTSKRIEIEGLFFRYRRGRLVEIPPEWVGKVTDPATIRQRKSKMIHKHRRGKPKPVRSNGIQS
jgi:hypothetical protein